jgi:seryl-tRNA synthetase
MIDLKDLRENPDRYRIGAANKRVAVDIDRLLVLDTDKRDLQARIEALRAQQNKLAKETGPQIGKLMGALKKASDEEKPAIEAQIAEIKAAPAALKAEIQQLDQRLNAIEPELAALLLAVPMPADDDVPIGTSADDNVELRIWTPDNWDPTKTFYENKGFQPKTHLELCENLGLVDYPRGVKLAGSRSYFLTGDGMKLHQAILRYAFDFMVANHGFKPMSVPVLVRENAMVGTGFFPGGRAQSYLIDETRRWQIETDEDEPDESSGAQSAAKGQDLYLTGTGEVGLMGLHMDEILDEADLPLQYVTVSTCFRREAGAAGKDTAGLYRVHQFDKVEQVVICRADEAESRAWHQKMIGFVEDLLQSLNLPYRLLQCCTGDLGVKNADMIDLECWMPGRGDLAPDGSPTGAWSETHSASRLYDFQTRRLNMRYRQGGEAGKGPTTICHSLNNTVAASPRLMIPILEMEQNPDGSVTIPEVLRPYMGGQQSIGPR